MPADKERLQIVGCIVLVEEREAVERQAEAARQWVSTPEGRQAMAESRERASKVASEFREAQRVDPEDLHKPITI